MWISGILESQLFLSVYILMTRELPDDSGNKSPYNSKLLNNTKAVLEDGDKDSSVLLKQTQEHRRHKILPDQEVSAYF